MCDPTTFFLIASTLVSTASAVKGQFAAGHDRMVQTQAAAKTAADAKKQAATVKTNQDLDTLTKRKEDYASRRVGTTQVGSAAAGLFSPRSFFAGA